MQRRDVGGAPVQVGRHRARAGEELAARDEVGDADLVERVRQVLERHEHARIDASVADVAAAGLRQMDAMVGQDAPLEPRGLGAHAVLHAERAERAVQGRERDRAVGLAARRRSTRSAPCATSPGVSGLRHGSMVLQERRQRGQAVAGRSRRKALSCDEAGARPEVRLDARHGREHGPAHLAAATGRDEPLRDGVIDACRGSAAARAASRPARRSSPAPGSAAARHRRRGSRCSRGSTRSDWHPTRAVTTGGAPVDGASLPVVV